jgi:hypothetical protein
MIYVFNHGQGIKHRIALSQNNFDAGQTKERFFSRFAPSE